MCEDKWLLIRKVIVPWLSRAFALGFAMDRGGGGGGWDKLRLMLSGIRYRWGVVVDRFCRRRCTLGWMMAWRDFSRDHLVLWVVTWPAFTNLALSNVERCGKCQRPCLVVGRKHIKGRRRRLDCTAALLNCVNTTNPAELQLFVAQHWGEPIRLAAWLTFWGDRVAREERTTSWAG